MIDPYDRVLTRPSEKDLVAALEEAVRTVNGKHRQRILAWPPKQPELPWLLAQVRDEDEGEHQFNAGEKSNRGVPNRSALLVVWWTDRAGGKHVRLHARRGPLNNDHLKYLLHSRETRPPLALIYPDLLFQRQAQGRRSYQCLCPCGAVGEPWHLGWMGPCCGPCHDAQEAGDLSALPARRTWRLRGPQEYPRQLSFSPDGGLLAVSGGSSRCVWVWDTVTGELRHTITGETETLALFSPVGGELALFNPYGEVRIVDSPEAEPRLAVRTHGYPNRIAVSPTEFRVGILSSRDLVVADLRQGTVSHMNSPRSPFGHCLVFAPGGGLLVGAPRGQLVVWDVDSCDVVRERDLGPDALVLGHAITPDGSLLLVSVSNEALSRSTLRVFSFPDLIEQRAPDPLPDEPAVRDDPTVSPDGQLLALSSWRGLQVQQVRGDRGVFLQEAHGRPSSMTAKAFSPAGDLLAVLMDDHSVRLWPASVFRP